jgi:hypothetical protein
VWSCVQAGASFDSSNQAGTGLCAPCVCISGNSSDYRGCSDSRYSFHRLYHAASTAVAVPVLAGLPCCVLSGAESLVQLYSLA